MAVRRTKAARPKTSSLVERNISALLERRRSEKDQLTWQERVPDRIGRFIGSMTFVWLHAGGVFAWIAVNLGAVPWIPRFDPGFVALALATSVEAIFISIFVLIAQNRMQIQADKRAELNLQISLLSEHEITRLLKIVTDIGVRLNIPSALHAEIAELRQDVRPEEVLETLERRTQNGRGE